MDILSTWHIVVLCWGCGIVGFLGGIFFRGCGELNELNELDEQWRTLYMKRHCGDCYRRHFIDGQHLKQQPDSE